MNTNGMMQPVRQLHIYTVSLLFNFSLLVCNKYHYKELIFNNKLFTADTNNNNNNTSQVQSETCAQELEHRLQAIESKLSEVCTVH